MKTTAIAASCRQCGCGVEDAMLVILCDCCLDARLAYLDRAPAFGTGMRRTAGFAIERVRALTLAAA
jgi:hypothetical protein